NLCELLLYTSLTIVASLRTNMTPDSRSQDCDSIIFQVGTLQRKSTGNATFVLYDRSCKVFREFVTVLANSTLLAELLSAHKSYKYRLVRPPLLLS
ncbi:hypothetical protein J6590_077050, partial [Homalodisca vitripennis]